MVWEINVSIHGLAGIVTGTTTSAYRYGDASNAFDLPFCGKDTTCISTCREEVFVHQILGQRGEKDEAQIKAVVGFLLEKEDKEDNRGSCMNKKDQVFVATSGVSNRITREPLATEVFPRPVLTDTMDPERFIAVWDSEEQPDPITGLSSFVAFESTSVKRGARDGNKNPSDTIPLKLVVALVDCKDKNEMRNEETQEEEDIHKSHPIGWCAISIETSGDGTMQKLDVPFNYVKTSDELPIIQLPSPNCAALSDSCRSCETPQDWTPTSESLASLMNHMRTVPLEQAVVSLEIGAKIKENSVEVSLEDSQRVMATWNRTAKTSASNTLSPSCSWFPRRTSLRPDLARSYSKGNKRRNATPELAPKPETRSVVAIQEPTLQELIAIAYHPDEPATMITVQNGSATSSRLFLRGSSIDDLTEQLSRLYAPAMDDDDDSGNEQTSVDLTKAWMPQFPISDAHWNFPGDCSNASSNESTSYTHWNFPDDCSHASSIESTTSTDGTAANTSDSSQNSDSGSFQQIKSSSKGGPYDHVRLAKRRSKSPKKWLKEGRAM